MVGSFQNLRKLGIAAALVQTLSLPLAWSNAGAPFQNTGGMWMPQQMTEHADALRQLGLQIDPALLSDPQSGLMQAIVSLDGCSGTFISPDGLIITNHHCIEGMLNLMQNQDRQSGVSSNFIGNGFHARERSEERNVGLSKRLFVTQKVQEVTDQVLSQIEAIADPAARQREIDLRIKRLIAQSEHGRPSIKTEVKAFYQGARYFLIERLELQDVRMVFAPPKSIGAMGEDPDNWRFPRHTGDFGIIRAYVGPDGNPAPYSPNNVPYHPQNIAPVSGRGLQSGSLVMVAGFPGITYRLNTAHQIEYQLERLLPLSISMDRAVIGTLDDLARQSDTLRDQSDNLRKGLMNRLQKQEGSVSALQRINFLDKKRQFENELQTWIQADSSRQQRFGRVLTQMQTIRGRLYQNARTSVLLSALTGYSRSLSSALTLIRMAEERAQTDDLKRSLGFQERDWKRVRQSMLDGHVLQNRQIDLAIMNLVRDRALAATNADDMKTPLASAFLNLLRRLDLNAVFAHTELDSLDRKADLFDHATPESLQQSSDSLLQFALRVRELQRSLENDIDAVSGELALVVPQYIAALSEFSGKPIAPDANSTLRVTFGQVKGFTEPTDNRFMAPFSTVSQMIQKAFAHMLDSTPHQHYDIPQAMVQAYRDHRTGVYADPQFGEIPVDFVADVDTTGGNSGSAAFDKNGHYVGILFDGTMHSLYGDYKFDANTRSVLLDVRFVLWYLSEVAGAKNILAEVNPHLPSECEVALGKDDIRR